MFSRVSFSSDGISVHVYALFPRAQAGHVKIATVMFTFISIIAAGVAIGIIIRRSGFSLSTSKSVSWTVRILIALFGISLGSDRSVLSSLSSLGIPALIISTAGIAGSIIFSVLYSRFIVLPAGHQVNCKEQSAGYPLSATVASEDSSGDDRGESPSKVTRKSYGNILMSLLHTLELPSVLLAGIAIGYMGMIPGWVKVGQISHIALGLLVFQVGLGLGARPDFRTIASSVNFRTLLLPVSTIVGTVIFTFLASYLISYSVKDTLAIGCGFGYYSLSSMLIVSLMSASAGVEAATEMATLSLLVNMIREVAALVLCRGIAARGKTSSAISLAGINSMDVCLPMICQRPSQENVMLSAIIHGIFLEFSVPVLLGFFCR